MQTVVAVLACFLIFETTAGNVQPDAEHNLEKRWDLTDIKLPDLDVSLHLRVNFSHLVLESPQTFEHLSGHFFSPLVSSKAKCFEE